MKKQFTPTPLTVALGLALAGLLQSSHAATDTWNGATSGVWDTATSNWVSDGTDTLFNSGNDALFTGTPTNSVTTATGLSVGSITLDNTFTGSVTLSGANTVGGPVNLNGGTLLLGNNTAAGTATINLGGGTFGVSATGLNVANAINVTGVTTIGQNVNNSFTLSGALTGSGTLQNKTATGSAPNVFFTGNLSGFTGTLSFTGQSANASACWRVGAVGGATADLSNATLNLTSGGANQCLFGFIDATTTANTLKVGTLNGNGIFQGSYNTTVTNAVEVASGTFSGVIGRSGNSMDRLSLTKVGSGTLRLTGNSIYTQGTTVNGGTLELGTGAAGTGTGVIRGTLTINSGATVKLNKADALGWNANVSVTAVNVNGGTIDNAVNGNNSYLANYVLTGGTMTSSGSGLFNFGPSTGITSNASSMVSTISAGIDNRGNTMTYNVASGTTVSGVDLLVSGTIIGAGGLTKTGAGVLSLTGVNTYTGTTAVNVGTLMIGASGSLGTTATTVASGAAIGGDGSLGGNLTLNSGAKFVFSLSQTLSVTAGTVSFGGFSVADLVGLNSTVADGTYNLIDGAATFNYANLSNIGAANAYDLGNGKSAYFGPTGLQLLVVPEPSSFVMLLGGIGSLMAFRRRRS